MNKITALLIALFFFFLMTEAAQPVNMTSTIINSEIITAKAQIGNDMWIGTTRGLYIVDANNQKATHLTAENSVLPSNKVMGIAVTTDGNVYVATEKGVFRYDGSAYLVINTENSNLPANGITSIASDNNNNLWVGTSNNGLIVMNNYKCRFFNTRNSVLTTNHVAAIKSDVSGNIFVQLDNKDVVEVGERNMAMISTPKIIENAVASSK